MEAWCYVGDGMHMITYITDEMSMNFLIQRDKRKETKLSRQWRFAFEILP